MRSASDTHPSVPALQICLFGGVIFRVAGDRVTNIATRKAEALLIYLVCNPQPQPRETLAELLWDDLPAERAAGNLRLTLNQLRKSFAPFLDITRQTIALRQDVPCWSDVQTLAAGLAGEPRDVETLTTLLALYRGDFLQGFHLRDARGFGEWQAEQAEYWRQQALAAMRQLVDGYVALSSYSEAITWAGRILRFDPLDEAAHRQLMLLHARKGQRGAALRQYQACMQIMQQEFGLDPEPATETLYGRICRMSTQRPHSLPPNTRALLGRSDELVRLYAWICDPNARLMSIVGAGGSGKTHLALTAGWRVVSECFGPCGNGVFYIPLIVREDTTERIDDVGLLMAIARALHIPRSGSTTLLDQVIRQLHDQELLLIIDNGELLDPSARLALGTLIQHIADLRVLVPSRERLKLRDEWVLDLGGLAHPALPSHILTRQQEERLCMTLPEYAAVQLFLERAGQLQGAADFSAYNHQDQLAIGRICQLVHGLPLAIELVTPWLRVRSAGEIVEQVAHLIDMLVVDMPDLPERHRSVRAVFDYSWQLISDEERAALAQLSVFPASFTAAAAETIASVRLARLAALRDKSLIQSLAIDGETRYVLHPLLRHLAWEKLQLDGARARAIQAAHAQYFAALAARCENQLRGVHGPDAIQLLEAEIDNIRAGWQWAATTCDVATLGHYSIALHDFCAIRGWELEGCYLFRGAVAALHGWTADDDTPEADLLAAARVLSCYAEFQYMLGALDIAEATLQQSRFILSFQAIEDAPELMFIYRQLGLIAYWRGAYTEALHYLRLTLQMAEEQGDQDKCGDALLAICGVAYAQGDWSYAQAVAQRSLATYQAKDDRWGIVHALRFRGMIALAQADVQLARRSYQESLELAQQIGYRIGEALVWDRLGLLELAESRPEQSTAALQRGLAMFQDLGVDVESGRTLCHLARAALTRGEAQAAQQSVAQTLQIAGRVQLLPLMIESLAVALDLWMRMNQSAEDATAREFLRSLGQHPASTADTRMYIAALLGEEPVQAHSAGNPAALSSIEAIQAEVMSLVAGISQPEREGTRDRVVV
ncbi:MAG TPA: BTAD domain-containing putative transcriptional regulator [Herpetosiphonaceae bacterium]